MIRTLAAPRRSGSHTARIGLLGLGTAAPGMALQTDAAAHCETLCCDDEPQRQFLRRVFANSGVRRRGSVLVEHDDDLDRSRAFYRPRATPADLGPTTAQRMAIYAAEAPRLAEAAGRRALESAGLDGPGITHLITVTCTGFFAPGLDYELIRRLGLPADVQRLQLGFMGCHGAFNALAAARQIAQADALARVLVCCVELCSLHLAYGFDPQKLVANALFADGAAAAVVGQPAHGGGALWQVQDCASLLVPDSADAMTWRIGDHGFAMTLSPRIPEMVRQSVPQWLCGWLRPHGLTPADVSAWAIHPGGPKVLTAVADAVGFPQEHLAASRQVLAEYGNMSSGTVLFVLEKLMQSRPTGPCVALGFGPGLMAEGVLLGSGE